MNKYNEERNLELIKMYQEGNDEAFTELFESNQGLVNKALDKYRMVKLLDFQDKYSWCMRGFEKSARNYDPSKGIKISSYFIRNMQKDIETALDYFNWNDRKENIRKSKSFNAPVGNNNDGNDRSLIDEVGGKNSLYFEFGYSDDMKKAIEFAMIRVKPEIKPYMLEIVLGDLGQTEVGNELGLSRAVMSYQMINFKKRIKQYFENRNLEVIL